MVLSFVARSVPWRIWSGTPPCYGSMSSVSMACFRRTPRELGENRWDVTPMGPMVPPTVGELESHQVWHFFMVTIWRLNTHPASPIIFFVCRLFESRNTKTHRLAGDGRWLWDHQFLWDSNVTWCRSSLRISCPWTSVSPWESPSFQIFHAPNACGRKWPKSSKI